MPRNPCLDQASMRFFARVYQGSACRHGQSWARFLRQYGGLAKVGSNCC